MRETLTCLVVMHRLLDCDEVRQAIADHGGSLAEIREAIGPVTEESRTEPSGLARWRVRRSYLDDELRSAFTIVMPNARKQLVPVSGPSLAKAMLETSPSLQTLVAPHGMEASWFDPVADE